MQDLVVLENFSAYLTRVSASMKDQVLECHHSLLSLSGRLSLVAVDEDVFALLLDGLIKLRLAVKLGVLSHGQCCELKIEDGSEDDRSEQKVTGATCLLSTSILNHVPLWIKARGGQQCLTNRPCSQDGETTSTRGRGELLWRCMRCQTFDGAGQWRTRLAAVTLANTERCSQWSRVIDASLQ
jgi:hypothetical protein